MDDCSEALIGFVGAHSDAFELFEFAEEILDQVPPFVRTDIAVQMSAKRCKAEVRVHLSDF